jgi:imidazolonepropionase-like amidohydrolase
MIARIMTPALAAVLLATGAAPLAAQLGSYNPPAGPQETVAIRGAMIHPVSGPVLPSGTIVISGGKIQAVGANVAVPQGARVIDGTGLHVWPGMMEAGTTMGLAEIPQGATPTMDVSETGDINPNAHAINGINSHSAHIGVTRVVGITHVVSSPRSGTISGQAALINLAGDTPPTMAVVPNVAMYMTLPRAGGFGGGFGRGGGFGQQAGSTQDADRARTARLDSLKMLFADAKAYGQAHEAYAKDATLPRPKTDLQLAALLPMLRGEMPVMFAADRVTDMRGVITFAEETGLKPIIIGGRDAWMMADELKAKDIPVILTGVMALPSREDDPYDVNWTAPAKLAAAGVRFAITSGDDGAESRNLPYVAGMAAAYGLSPADALKAITLAPAEMFGVADRLGTLEAGKMANLVVTTGDLLEATTLTKHLFIDGREVPLGSKHEQLYEMFIGRP